MTAIIWLVDTCFRIYFWILIGHVVLSWLVTFNVVNTRQPLVNQVGTALWRLSEPVLGPIRRLLPSLGGIDISPILALVALEFLRRFVVYSVLVPLASDLR